MPHDNAELANVEIEFPRLQPNTTEACPASIEEILEYLRMESPDGESVQANQLRFLRTALVERHRYWIWSFHEADGRACYLTVSLSPDRARCIGYEENYYGLTPDQYLLGDFHNVF
jgi:hypothetical protein